MAVVAISNSPHHYIRTIHTSFTAAHPAWSRSHAHSNNHHSNNASLNVNLNVSVSPLLTSNHANLPLYSTAPKHHQGYVQHGHSHIQGQGLQNYNSNNGNNGGNGNGPAHQHQGAGAGGRRRAYAFRAPHPVPRHPQRQQTYPLPQQAATQTAGKTTYKFDPFADEPQPQRQSPSLSTLASLSVPPTPRLASATLPPRRAPAPAPAATRLPSPSLPSRTSPPPVSSRTPSPPHSRSPPPVTSRTPSPPAQRQFNYHLQQQQRNIWAAPAHAPSPSPAHSFNNNPSAPRSFTPAPYHAHARSASTPPLAHRQSYYAPRSVSPPQSQPQNQTRFEVEVYDDSTPPSALSTRPSTPSTPAPTPVDAAEKAAKDLEKARAAKEARARIVAGILLNRAWALGKGTRRRGGAASRGLGAYGRCGVNGAGNGVGAAAGCGKGASGYVPSGLSRVVCAGEL